MILTFFIGSCYQPPTEEERRIKDSIFYAEREAEMAAERRELLIRDSIQQLEDSIKAVKLKKELSKKDLPGMIVIAEYEAPPKVYIMLSIR